MVMTRDVSVSAGISPAKLVKIEVTSKVQGFSRHKVKFNAAAKLTQAR